MRGAVICKIFVENKILHVKCRYQHFISSATTFCLEAPSKSWWFKIWTRPWFFPCDFQLLPIMMQYWRNNVTEGNIHPSPSRGESHRFCNLNFSNFCSFLFNLSYLKQWRKQRKKCKMRRYFPILNILNSEKSSTCLKPICLNLSINSRPSDVSSNVKMCR